MSDLKKCLISKDNGKLQIPYEDYAKLVAKAKQGREMRETRDRVLAMLSGFLGGESKAAEAIAKVEAAKAAAPVAPKAVEKVALEFGASEKNPVAAHAPTATPAGEPKQVSKARKVSNDIDVPPIKKDIVDHFNKLDDSGRLYSVFKQYYTCLNDACGGTVRVTMKDGFCSLWNYDEWEEFAFVDIFEGQLRIALDPRYTNALESLRLCEVPRLLSSRRNLVCVQVDDLNNTMLDVLVKAFEEVGLAAS